MRVGVVSDTHNHLGNVARIVELLNAAGVDRVVHTGDITQAKTLAALAKLDAPLVGVFGNNDERAALGEVASASSMLLVEPPLELTWVERRILVVHDPRDIDAVLTERDEGSSPHLILHGHDHRHTVRSEGQSLIFNPGECAGHMPGYNAVGVVDLIDLGVEILRF